MALLALPANVLAQEDAASATAEPVEMAKVRFLHGSHAGNLDFLVDGTVMSEGQDLGLVSEYTDIPAGKRAIRIRMSGHPEDSSLAEKTIKFKPGTHSTIVGNDGVHNSSVTEIRVIKDNPKPVVGKTQLRVVNLCSNCSGVSVLPDAGKAKAVAKKLGFLKASKYVNTKPGELDLKVKPGDTNQVTWDIDPVDLEDSTAKTLFLTRWIIDGTFVPVLATDAAASRLQALNASRVGPPVDVFVDGKLVSKKLAPGQAAKPITLLSGQHLVQVIETGSASAEGVAAAQEMTLQPGAQAMIVGVGSTLETAPAPTSKAPVAKTPKLRFVHADAETPTVDIEIRDLEPIEDLAFGDMTDYITLASDSSYFWIRPDDGSGGPFHEAPLDLGPGNYTAYVGGVPDEGTVELVIVPDLVAKKK
jgi:hypothetical protein